METAKIFNNGRSQAVRLPKAYRFSGEEVYIKKLGEMVILYPITAGWDILADGLRMFSEDFMPERDQPEIQPRDESLA